MTTLPSFSRPGRISTPRPAELRRLPRLRRAVEGPALGGHVEEELVRGEARAVPRLEPAAQLDEGLGAHEVDVAHGAAREGGEAEAEDRAHVGLARIGDDVVLD